MTDRWNRVGRLFDAAVALPAAERARFVAAADEADDVRHEVLSLLASHEGAAGFLEDRPPLDDVDPPAVMADGASPEPPPLAHGTMVGPYRIEAVLGSGGMGVVYEAYDTRLMRRVAVKSLSPRLSRADTQRERLKQEARAAAALTHPGIGVVYALEEAGDQLFIVSELLDGETMRALMERGPIEVARAVDMAIEIVDALAAAHQRGIVHRDLKPENIICTPGGRLKIVDFGLAQFEGAARDLVSMTRLTEPGLVAGTPPYMAPEQLLGRTTDARTDQFALGVLLYEMCTGSHPFGGASLPSTIARILASAPLPPPPGDSPPAALWRVIQRCLQKEPSDRFAATTDLLEALTAARADTVGSRAAAGSHVEPAAQPDVAGSRIPASASPGRGADALRWWRFHQIAATAGYAAMVWPSWHVHRSLGRAGLFFFFSTVAAVVIASSLRLHLWFSSRVYPEDLERQRAEVARWTRAADVAFAALLIIAGIALPPERVGWAALLISFGSASAVVALFVEPATARAAFRSGRNG